MAFTYDLTTDLGKVRLLIPDTRTATPIFQDDEIEAFMVMEHGLKRAAALALETVASDEAYVLKVVSLLDLSTNGAQTADALMKRAAQLRKQADQDEVNAAGGIEIASWVLDSNMANDAWFPGYYPWWTGNL